VIAFAQYRAKNWRRAAASIAAGVAAGAEIADAFAVLWVTGATFVKNRTTNRRRAAAAVIAFAQSRAKNRRRPAATADIAFEKCRAQNRRRTAAAIIAAVAMLLFVGLPEMAAAAQAQHEMVVAESEPAAQAGLEILRQGGNAIDAAVATALALGVTNAGSCGIGGGGFMLIYLAKSKSLYALDYREEAPQAATANMYMHNGQPDEDLARTGALAIAVPGELAGLDAALKRFGTMKFQALAAPAIKLASGGFPLSPHTAQEIVMTAPQFASDAAFHTVYYTADGKPQAAGATLYNHDLAALMSRLGDDPAANFYHGEIANTIADFIKGHGGIVTAADLAAYRPVWRDPIHLAYRNYVVYTVPPPSSGGIVLEMLGMLSTSPVAGLGVNSPPYLARLIEVMRQGFIDRQQYADPAFVNVPVAELLSPQKIAEDRDRAFHHTNQPPAVPAAHDHGTSNFAIVDKAGNVVDVTTTVNTIFGAKLMVPGLGLILNDEMDDFAVAPGVPNAFKLVGDKNNEVAPDKRPLSSMSPVIALADGRPVLVAGGSGGPTIISGVIQVMLNVLDFDLNPGAAILEPRIHQQAQPEVVVVEQSLPVKTKTQLTAMGYTLKVVPDLGAVSAIRIGAGSLHGAFDPRKGGGAVGD
jgi:gamma-glutamyltranspeptidase / glutathione hydrolase